MPKCTHSTPTCNILHIITERTHCVQFVYCLSPSAVALVGLFWCFVFIVPALFADSFIKCGRERQCGHQTAAQSDEKALVHCRYNRFPCSGPFIMQLAFQFNHNSRKCTTAHTFSLSLFLSLSASPALCLCVPCILYGHSICRCFLIAKWVYNDNDNRRSAPYNNIVRSNLYFVNTRECLYTILWLWFTTFPNCFYSIRFAAENAVRRAGREGGEGGNQTCRCMSSMNECWNCRPYDSNNKSHSIFAMKMGITANVQKKNWRHFFSIIRNSFSIMGIWTVAACVAPRVINQWGNSVGARCLH